MKKFLLIVMTVMLFSKLSYADNIVTYGKSTFGEVGNNIIFGSYGDEYGISEFDKLGANDYIGELNFKNVLAYEGYTEAYDYNPSYDGYYDDFYKKELPDTDLQKITIRGLGANPREEQDVYVLREEFEKYSAQYQDVRIEKNRNEINNVDNRHTIWNEEQDVRLDDIDVTNAYQDMRLTANKNNILINRGEINRVEQEQTDWNETQDNKINKNTTKIQKNKKAIKEETKERKKADKKLQKNINKEEKARIKGDKRLQNNINTETNQRVDGDTVLQNNIDDVDAEHTVINNRQDVSIDNNTANIANNSHRINDVDNRVSELEQTQYRVDAELQIYDGRDWGFSAFVNNNARHGNVDAVGVKVTVKLGKDYAVKRMDELERKIDKYIELKEQEDFIVVPTETGMAIKTKF